MQVTSDQLDFDAHGAALHVGAALFVLAELEEAIADTPSNRAGVRLYAHRDLSHLLRADGPIGMLASVRLGEGTQPVRAILFDKTEATNWALGWHQDRSVAVAARHDVPGHGPWSVKSGVPHVEPPFSIIEQMVTLRIHLDPVVAENAPLLIAPGSHRLGRISEGDIGDVVDRFGSYACLAERGDIWVYATPIVHASAASTRLTGRRVLHVDYCAAQLADGLDWAGI